MQIPNQKWNEKKKKKNQNKKVDFFFTQCEKKN